ncbi:hypothetical protein ADM96_31130 [Burkholderia sp. ST111]|nr:hypothetical protein ADM96_31130 [Burkholderia sp. ST111]
MTGAWFAPKESLPNDDTDYAAGLHPDVSRERNAPRRCHEKAEARPKAHNGKIEPGDDARLEVEV